MKQHHTVVNTERAAPKIGVRLSLRIASQQSLVMTTVQHKCHQTVCGASWHFEGWRKYEKMLHLSPAEISLVLG